MTENIKKSNVFIIDQNERFNQKISKQLLILGFEQTIIILEQSSFAFLSSILSINLNMSVCFLSNTRHVINENIKKKIVNQEMEINETFKQEISNFQKEFRYASKKKILKKICKYISQCISAYLIKKSYLQHNQYRIEEIIDYIENYSISEINSNDYLELRIIGKGSLFTSLLVYHITRGELYVIKKPNHQDIEIPKLIYRETTNYKKMNHPFVPRFYGIVKDSNYIVIEFIKGKTLDDDYIKKMTINQKLTIIFEIMVIIKFLHDNKFIYRDLKPDNVMIDKNKRIILIDFDRLIENEENTEEIAQTADINAYFNDPEVNETRHFTYKSDIYSIGKMIEYLIGQENSNPQINKIIQKCTEAKSCNRPNISELISEFNSTFRQQVQIDNITNTFEDHFENIEIINSALIKYKLNRNDAKSIFNIAMVFDRGEYATQNINKAIHYLLLAVNQNYDNAQYNLGFIYNEGKYITRDINKAIHYLTLAANQDYAPAQNDLAVIYYENKYIERDINEAIHYYLLAANQNYMTAQHNLGIIYCGGKYVKQDINKGIHYLTLAANKNSKISQYILGIIYTQGEYITRNINKAIQYLTLAANQNFAPAQNDLAVIYYENKYVARDINKAIHYYLLAANQNLPEALCNLATIYYEGKYITRDINKAMNYLTIAANQNLPVALCNLALIYYEGKYITRDINKAMNYLTIASNQNLPVAQCNLAAIYYEGKYITRDINKAMKYWTLAANQNLPKALYNLGYIYYEGKYIKQDINKAMNYLTLAANQNLPEAQFLLGFFYYEGNYIERNVDKSIHYLTNVANQGYSQSQTYLGIIYYKGLYIPKDINKAIHYFSLAAKSNNALAQFNLGLLYYDDLGVTKDISKAIYYLSLAADKNLPNAQNNLGIIYSQGKYITRDINKALHYFTLAANQNLPEAQYNLGVIYYDKEYGVININKAIHYFSLAANRFLSGALFALGSIYFKGKYVKKDENKAIHFFTLAANQNHSGAQLFMGLYYYHEISEIKKGIYYIMLSSENGNHYAHFLNGYLHHEGKYIKRDIQKAIHYYKNASSFNIKYAKNNLGIIYKHGYKGIIEPNSSNAIVYFKEAIAQSNDFLSAYNLAHIYIYDDAIKQNLDEAIDILSNPNVDDIYYESMFLLSLAIIKKYDSNIKNILTEIEKIRLKNGMAADIVYNYIEDMMTKSNFKLKYEAYRKKDFLYDMSFSQIEASLIEKESNDANISNYNKSRNITIEFYKGLGDIL
ncbi:hypothetical protein M9Y10_036497 [Tritrichomonas musculus]|uniref:Protein kinase domain-containing protein n=1 Tax=Tritrichomonas musculus TaxID=1915356 RepID=A0ABR2GW82_9EUKA